MEFRADFYPPAQILQALFPGDPLMCVGTRSNGFTINHLSALGPFVDKMSHIVPSPMNRRVDLPKEGYDPQEILAATGPRRFIVVVSEPGIPRNAQAAILFHLAKTLPLALVVSDAQSTLEGWFFCEGLGENIVREFFEQAVTLGASKCCWSCRQHVRMPGGKRVQGYRQYVVYFDAEAVGWTGDSAEPMRFPFPLRLQRK